MATNTIRWQAISRTVDLARDRVELIDVTIDGTGYPGDTAGPECVYLGNLDGQLSVPLTRGPDNRIIYDDEFEITWAFDVLANGRSREETMARADEIIAAWQDVIATDAQLGALDGVISARMIAQHGPLGIDVKGVGLVVVAQLIVSIHARYE